jgi:hypothetical protein
MVKHDKHALEGEPLPTEEEVSSYEKLKPLFRSAHEEMKELSKKKPDGVMTDLKVQLLNRLLTELKEAMKADPSAAYLDLLDRELLPQHSDVVLVMSQYEAAIKAFSGRFHGKDSHSAEYGGGRWFTANHPPEGRFVSRLDSLT